MIDGIVLHNINYELQQLVGGRIDKITQPEKDELLIHIRANGKKEKLLLSAQASMPRIQLTALSKENPKTAPAFCMLLRKHIGNGRIVNIRQIGLERILVIQLEQLNELGDLCQYDLIIEIMGKHSNIFLCESNGNILDCIKRIGSNVSSVRQVFPGRTYERAPSQNKFDLREIDSKEQFLTLLNHYHDTVSNVFMQAFTGISPFIATHICYAARLNGESHLESFSPSDLNNLYLAFCEFKYRLQNALFRPTLITDVMCNYSDFHSILLVDELPESKTVSYESINVLIDTFFETKELQARMKQRSFDLRRLVQTALERNYKKLDLQNRQLHDTEDMDKFKLKGELLLANQYLIQPKATSLEVLNYYTNETITLSLDPQKSGIENANASFDKYNKKKRTRIAVTEQIDLTQKEIDYLETVKFSLENVLTQDDIEEIRKELIATGYIRFRKTDKHIKSKSKPHCYMSSDGFELLVGKNNLQNEELSTKVASNSDWWFHTKNVPGSHVIVRCLGKELPDKTFEEAAALAAYYSKAKDNTKVTVDYTQVKNLKKPAGSVPGLVIYPTNYSLVIAPSIETLTKLS
jgi:predicted ribosome quality control (RQC) complex YloA/Tae2 family protein